MKPTLSSSYDRYIRRFICAWMYVLLFFLIFTPAQSFSTPAYLNGANILIFLALIAIFFTLLSLCELLSHGISDKLLMVVMTALLFLLSYKARSIYFTLGLCLIFALCANYSLNNRLVAIPHLELSGRAAGIVCAGLITFFAIFAGGVTVLRYLTYSAPNFDFGIFCNMFYNMKESLLPLVTSERDGLYSHFAVHLSPIFYLLLPIYAIFPSPITLQISQALILASGVIPLYLIARKFYFSRTASLCISAVYVLYPAMSGGTFYDVHENMFLAPLLLWMFWAYESGRIPCVYLFAVLTLLVKEDAALYILCFALFLILSKRDIINGGALALISVAYFIFAVWYLESYGFGAMTGRFSDYYYTEGDGLLALACTFIKDPMLILYNVFSYEKLEFALQLLLPLCFMPFATSRLSRFTLLLPAIVINFMPSYKYMHVIYFQYTFASSVFLIYLTAMNLRDAKPHIKERMLPLMLICTASAFLSTSLGHTAYLARYMHNRDEYKLIGEVLESIPEDASVTASTFFLPHLSQRDVIYQEGSAHEVETDCIVLDLRYEESEKEEKKEQYLLRGYTLTEYHKGSIAVLEKPK